jgi:hypothetical protein
MKKQLAYAIVAVCAYGLPAAAQPMIEGASTATLVTDPGPYLGWYLYELDIAWELNGPGSGLSHWDVLLKVGCAAEDHLIEFPDPGGWSTSEQFPDDPYSVSWDGYFERYGEPTIPSTDPLLKYEQTPGQPYEAGPEGYGRFWFYSNIIPEYGTYEEALAGKAGVQPIVFGDLIGAYPSCTTTPEPTTLSLLALGGLLLARRRW